MEPDPFEPAQIGGRVVIITGAAGFVGFHLAHRLLDLGWSVAGVDNLNGYYDPALKQARLDRLAALDRFHFTKLDVDDAAAFRELVDRAEPDVIVHLAAQAGVRYSIEQPEAYLSNVAGFLSVLEACRHRPVQHLIYASSSSVYGMNDKVPFSEDDAVNGPVSLYAVTKRANELMAYTYAHLYGVRATGLRFFTVYGPWGRPDMAYFKFTRAIASGEAIDVYNGGHLERDFTYIDDIVSAIVKLVDAPPTKDGASPPHRIFNIGNNAPVKLERLIAAIETALGRTAQRRLLPMQPGDVRTTYADISKLAAAVGFAPKTSIEDGIARFVQWYRDFHGVAGPAGAPGAKSPTGI